MLPSKAGISVADIAAGTYAYSGILLALLRREGATLEGSMLEALGEWMGFPLYYTLYGGDELKRSGARLDSAVRVRSSALCIRVG